MNHLLLSSLLLITMSAEKCNERQDGEGTAANAPATEQQASTPAQEPGEVAGSDAEAQKAMLAGQRWYILTLNEEAMGLPEGAERPWLELNDGQLQGFGGCNNLMGSYTMEDDRITFAEVGSTKKYCPELQNIERAILDMLAEVNSYRMDEDSLVLQQGSRDLALLKTVDE